MTKPGGVDAWTLYRKLAAAMRMDSGFRAEVYQWYERDTCGAGCEILEMAIAEAADEAGVLLLVRELCWSREAISGCVAYCHPARCSRSAPLGGLGRCNSVLQRRRHLSAKRTFSDDFRRDPRSQSGEGVSQCH